MCRAFYKITEVYSRAELSFGEDWTAVSAFRGFENKFMRGERNARGSFLQSLEPKTLGVFWEARKVLFAWTPGDRPTGFSLLRHVHMRPNRVMESARALPLSA